MRFFLTLLLLPLLAQAQSPAQANKQLFDRTVDELNFRTFEKVYDKHFPRQKYPATLRTAASRKQFAQFEGNAELQRLFGNYNGVAERYKTHFGSGATTQVEFERQLRGILLDRNFEFFIRGLPREEKTTLVRAEEQVIKKAAAQYNASGEAAAPVAAAAEEAPLTTHGPLPGDEAAAPAADAAAAAAADDAASAATPADGPRLRGEATPAGSGPGWVGYLTLLSSLGSLALLLYVARVLLPEVGRLRRRLRALEAGQPAPAAPDEAPDEPAHAAEAPVSRTRAFFNSLRPGPALTDDHYEDDDEAAPEEGYDDDYRPEDDEDDQPRFPARP